MLPWVPASLSWDWYLFGGSVGKRFAVLLRHALLGAIGTVAQGRGVTLRLATKKGWQVLAQQAEKELFPIKLPMCRLILLCCNIRPK
jgi:hypothetical protein